MTIILIVQMTQVSDMKDISLMVDFLSKNRQTLTAVLSSMLSGKSCHSP